MKMDVILPKASECRYYKEDFNLIEEMDKVRVFTKDWFYLGDHLENPADKSKDEHAPKNTIMLLTGDEDGYNGYIPNMVNCPCMPFYDVWPTDMPIRKLTPAEQQFICLTDALNQAEMLEKWKTLFYDKYVHNERFEDSDTLDIAYGFFIALGATPEQAYKMYEECIKYGEY